MEMEQSKEKQGVPGTVLVAILSVVLMAVSALLLFIPQIKLIYICYFICGLAIAAGIYMIVRYFMTDAFRNMNEYGFSGGMSMVLLGLCGMLRAESLADSFVTILGIALVLSGILKLQYAMDLKRMKDALWGLVLIISMTVMAASVCVILKLFEERSWALKTTWYIMLIDGGISLLILVYTTIRLKIFKNREQKEKEEKAAENKEEVLTGSSEASRKTEGNDGQKREPDENAGAGSDVLQEMMDEMDTEIQQEVDTDDVQ